MARETKHKETSSKKVPSSSFIISPIVNRVKAFMIDSFLILMPILYVVLYLIMGSGDGFSENMLAGWIYILTPHFVITISFWFFKSQTPGYKAHEIKLVDTNLQHPKLYKLVARYFAFILSSLSLIGLLLAIFRRDKKTFHDLISGTMPIQAKE